MKEVSGMKGRFISNNVPASILTGILWIVLWFPMILAFAEVKAKDNDFSLVFLIILIFFIPLALMIYFCYIPGSFDAGERYVVFRKGLRSKRIYYSSIEHIDVCQHKYAHTRYGATMFENLITIQTKDYTYEIGENAGSVYAEDLLENNGDIVSLLNNTDFIRLTEYIKARI